MSRSMELIIVLLYLSVYLSLSFVFCKNALHMFQQNRYELRRYTKWLFNINNFDITVAFIYVVFSILFCLFFKESLFATFGILAVDIVAAIYFIYTEANKHYIKDLDITKRVKRQIVCFAILMIAFEWFTITDLPLFLHGAVTVIAPYLLIYVMALITMPIEYLIKKRYENEARRILDSQTNLIKIGITGSFGKTSTKNIVTNIIGENYYTLMTPASYNTPMGITRTIRENLKPIHEVFVCEMGADKVNDISYLMDFVKPQYGIVTSIGPQHLNTFGTIENIIKEKMKEIEMLPEDGVGIVNYDIPYICDYVVENSCKIVSVGIKNQNADYFAKNIKYTKDGSTFTVKINKKNYQFETCLLGEHNITNILIGIALAIELNIPIKDIVENVKHVKQVEHRLQVRNMNGYTFIDDAFNSNPSGFRMAVDVLNMMPGKRVIVTPGLIDLGKEQDKYNKDLGNYMYGKVDYVILVGEKQTKPIYDGLVASGFNKNNIYVVQDVKLAFDYIYKNFSVKDTILLENDLPDAFSK